MSVINSSDVYYDPYDVEIDADPYPVFHRLREEAPLYYNEKHDFFAVSWFEDVERGLVDRNTFLSGRGGILELIKANIEMPLGTLIFEDPPVHTVHRQLLSRVFTPKKMNALEPQIREFCARALDPHVGSSGFDFVGDLGAQMPMRVIGMLLGIPEEDQEAVRDRVDASLRTEPGQPQDFSQGFSPGAGLEEYVAWRAEHPSDDLMTQLLNAEFEDETGTVRCLSRDEVLIYVNVLAGAGNETTNRLIGWTGKVLAEHPEQRRQLVDDPSLIPNAIEELLRYEPPAPHVGRYVARGRRDPRPDRPRGQRDPLSRRLCEPRRAALPERRHVRHPPSSRSAHDIRLRHSLLPRRGTGTSRRSHRPRGSAHPLPRMGHRLGQRQAGPDVDGTGLGDAAGVRAMSSERHDEAHEGTWRG